MLASPTTSTRVRRHFIFCFVLPSRCSWACGLHYFLCLGGFDRQVANPETREFTWQLRGKAVCAKLAAAASLEPQLQHANDEVPSATE